jgi:hypothetical protein
VLDITTRIDCPPAPGATVSTSRPLAGRWLAHNHLPPRRRALIAGDLIVGRRHLVEPTLTQAAMLARVSTSYAAAGKFVVFSQPHLRSSVESGERALLEAARGARPASSDAALDRIIARVGVDRVWAAIARSLHSDRVRA